MRLILFILGLLAAGTAFAQQTVNVPIAASFGPLRMTQGQMLRVCVSNVFSNAITNTDMPNKPLGVVVGFADALNGRLLEPVRELSLQPMKGICEEFRVPESMTEATALVLLAPLSLQDSKQFSTELLPICSAALFEGRDSQLRLVMPIQMVPKANLLIPRGRG